MAERASEVRALALCGSARHNGNSAFLLGKALEGAASAGAATELVFPSDLDIAGCRGCDACKGPGSAACVVQDDMQALYRKLEQANLWVFGAPVYWFHLSAQLKTVVDRLYGFFDFDKGYRLRLTGQRRGIAVVVQEAVSDAGAREVAAYLQKVMGLCGVEPAGALVSSNLRAPGAAAAREDLISQARALGASAVAALREAG